MLQSWFPRGVETSLVKYGAPDFEICIGEQLLCSDYLDKVDKEIQLLVKQGIQRQMPEGRLPVSVGSMGPVRQSVKRSESQGRR
mmetsp:Transcript_112229/g.194550  ORF Transcript_112229/g.194550 Transcript_112229/m.194550 type:complete len:84 (+) Transcript_112229:143-394(+)